MGITQFSISLLEPYIKEGTEVIELGAQNLYGDYKYGAYAHEWYVDLKQAKYECIDLNEENNSIPIDLRKTFKIEKQYDVVTDFGTSEHVGSKPLDWTAIYNCWKSKHDLCKDGGVIISENPKTGNWEGHGFNYYTVDFYNKLAELMEYEILTIGEHPAMNNTINGWNVYCVLRKSSKPFIKKSVFKKLDLRKE